MKTRTLTFLALCTIAWFSSACGASEPETGTQAGQSAESAAGDETSEATANAGSSIEVDDDSPLEALLGVPVFDDDAMNAWFRELDGERQAVTAECMLAEGFEFTPETSPAPAGPQGELLTSGREYAETFGFGIVASFDDATYDPDKDYSTANSKYIASLTEGEMEAYYTALHGLSQDEESEADSFNPAGCEGAGFKQVFSVMAVLEEIGPTAETYYERFISDSRTIELFGQWEACMADQGYSFPDPDEVRETFIVKLDRIISDDAAFEQIDIPDDIPEPGFVFSGDVFSPHPELTVDARAELDRLAEEEIATAVANWDCRDAIRADELAIQREYEAILADEIGPAVAAALDN